VIAEVNGFDFGIEAFQYFASEGQPRVVIRVASTVNPIGEFTSILGFSMVREDSGERCSEIRRRAGAGPRGQGDPDEIGFAPHLAENQLDIAARTDRFYGVNYEVKEARLSFGPSP